MKILINVPNLTKHGGVANYYHSIQNYLDKEVEYNIIGSLTEKEGFVHKIINTISGWYKFLLKILNKYDLVVLNPSLDYQSLFRDGIYLLIAKIFKIRIIVFFRGWNVEIEKNIGRKFLYLFKLFCLADAIIVLSTDFKQKLMEWGFKNKIFVETTTVKDTLIDTISPSLIINKNSKNKLNILFLSRLEKAKGIYDAINAFTILKKNYRNLTLNIVGDGSEYLNISRFIEKNNINDVYLMGYLRNREKADIFNNSRIFIFPSYHEGMPNSVLEAMAFGLPIVGYYAGGLKDFFVNGKMGYLSNDKSIDFLASKISFLLASPDEYNKISLYNHEFAKKNFLSSVVAKRLQNIFQTC